MKKETAVEWMFDKLLEEGPSGELRWHLKYDIFKIFEQAKAMEKEQIIEAHGTKTYRTTQQGVDVYEIKNAQQYYNETYEKRNRN